MPHYNAFAVRNAISQDPTFKNSEGVSFVRQTVLCFQDDTDRERALRFRKMQLNQYQPCDRPKEFTELHEQELLLGHWVEISSSSNFKTNYLCGDRIVALCFG